jgi:hypothetical protein
VDITVYLPDEIGQRAKDEDLKLSRMLRDAVTSELQRRDAVAEALDDVEVYEFELRDDPISDVTYTGRITGKRIAGDSPENVAVYLTTDRRVFAVYPDQMTYTRLDDPPEDFVASLLESGLADDEIKQACRALGIQPVIDL